MATFPSNYALWRRTKREQVYTVQTRRFQLQALYYFDNLVFNKSYNILRRDQLLSYRNML